MTLKTLFNAVTKDQEIICNVLLMTIPAHGHGGPCDLNIIDIEVMADILMTGITGLIRNIRKGAIGMTFFAIIGNPNVIATDGSNAPGCSAHSPH